MLGGPNRAALNRAVACVIQEQVAKKTVSNSFSLSLSVRIRLFETRIVVIKERQKELLACCAARGSCQEWRVDPPDTR